MSRDVMEACRGQLRRIVGECRLEVGDSERLFRVYAPGDIIEIRERDPDNPVRYFVFHDIPGPSSYLGSVVVPHIEQLIACSYRIRSAGPPLPGPRYISVDEMHEFGKIGR